jgi:hypothetical protein
MFKVARRALSVLTAFSIVAPTLVVQSNTAKADGMPTRAPITHVPPDACAPIFPEMAHSGAGTAIRHFLVGQLPLPLEAGDFINETMFGMTAYGRKQLIGYKALREVEEIEANYWRGHALVGKIAGGIAQFAWTRHAFARTKRFTRTHTQRYKETIKVKVKVPVRHGHHGHHSSHGRKAVGYGNHGHHAGKVRYRYVWREKTVWKTRNVTTHHARVIRRGFVVPQIGHRGRAIVECTPGMARTYAIARAYWNHLRARDCGWAERAFGQPTPVNCGRPQPRAVFRAVRHEPLK